MLFRSHRGAAVAGVMVAAVVLSSSAWFAALMLLSGQRPAWLVAMGVLVLLAYASGLLLTPRAARAALTRATSASAPAGEAPAHHPPADPAAAA